MNKLLFFVGIIFLIFRLNAQSELWGMTPGGGQYDKGVVYKTNFNFDSIEVIHHFDGSNGAYPVSDLVQAFNGKLYGAIQRGGINDNGVLISIDPITKVVNVIHYFAIDSNGKTPSNKLIQGKDSMLYGMTYNGGKPNSGVIFSYNIKSAKFETLYRFSNSVNSPSGDLLFANDNNLYGVTQYGGINGNGVLFQFNPITKQYNKKFDFSSTSGSYPLGGLIQASNGLIYGTTSTGGLNGGGTLFQYDILSGGFQKKLDLGGYIGSRPVSTLAEAPNGKIYGATYGGGLYNYGVLFEYDILSDTINVKKHFAFFYGEASYSKPLIASNGKLYGTVARGFGYARFGTIFEYDFSSDSCINVYNFDSIHGKIPYTGLIEVGSSVVNVARRKSNTTLLNISPNPSNGKFVITFDRQYETSEIAMYDVFGSKVLQRNYFKSKEIRFESLLPKGIYFIDVKLNEKSYGYQKIVIEG